MANRIPYYFLAPTWDSPPPPAGPIKLGSVITSLKTPERPLFTASLSKGSGETDQVYSTEQRNVAYSTDKFRQGQFGLFTRFLAVILGVGVDASVGWEKSDASLFKFDTLETTQFSPTPEFFQQCISARSVQLFLERSRYRKPIYIITGLKVVKGAQAKTIHSRTTSTEVSAEADSATFMGLSVLSGGPMVGQEKGDSKSMKWEGSDFVFAFRVRKVRVGKKSGSVQSEKDYTKGAMLERDVEVMKSPELEILGDEEGDASNEDFVQEEVMDDEEIIICAAPRY